LGGSLTQSAAPSYAVNSVPASTRAGVYTRGYIPCYGYDADWYQQRG